MTRLQLFQGELPTYAVMSEFIAYYTTVTL